MEKQYTYYGPLSAATLPADEAHPNGRHVQFARGLRVTLPDDNDYVKSLVARKYLVPVVEPETVTPATPATPVTPATGTPAPSGASATSDASKATTSATISETEAKAATAASATATTTITGAATVAGTTTGA